MRDFCATFLRMNSGIKRHRCQKKQTFQVVMKAMPLLGRIRGSHMEQLRIDLNDVLRFGAGGGAFLLAFAVHTMSLAELQALKLTGGQVTLGTAVAVLLGVLFYSFHRGLIYPLALRLIHIFIVPASMREEAIDWPWRISALEKKLNEARWRRRTDGGGVQSSLDRWGSQSHNLYVTALALGLALFLAPTNDSAMVSAHVLWITLLLVVAAAIVHDKRCCEMDLALYANSLTK